MAEVVFDEASRIYTPGATPAVDKLSLTVNDGELVVLVGPSGSGKSTALRMLAGLEPIDAGHLRIDGRDVVDVASKDRDIAMVFQSYALYPSKTVRDNMAFPLKMRGMDKAEQAKRVNEAAEILGLTEYLDRKPKALSGGQRQRVAMGRAIVREPRVFLMDEPLSNLDAKMRVQTRAQIAGLQNRLDVTTVYVTHDQVEAMTMGDRVAVLRDGKLQQYATPSELYDRPVNAFVAGFIGSPAMNLMDLQRSGDGVTLGGSTLPLTREVADAAGSADTVTVGLRPEDLSLTSEGDGIKAVVDVVEELGSESYLYAHMAEHPDTTLVVRGPGRTRVRYGETIAVRVDPDAVHAFDASSGERLAS
ncbi:sn-glycerol-3-phosphate ABC transporter ATP-binding protein UgpC [Actinomycetospora sp. NBRC 106378]|uniref:ABC transporter ATP-binding protein n=1 Tax=Actinomycetospora sp. NBRC 106378 TaxID=3032208 RepID=UPI0024A28254|nr:sn-glycerol-3-phosphate ABC transporter ATP-binding protein UgpC [Actinomycetospora sp. NBRC 106378]GLZ53727.1 ABC transporter ATP-binding protein [Actinomycetospora sp. NBRC 106378]